MGVACSDIAEDLTERLTLDDTGGMPNENGAATPIGAPKGNKMLTRKMNPPATVPESLRPKDTIASCPCGHIWQPRNISLSRCPHCGQNQGLEVQAKAEDSEGTPIGETGGVDAVSETEKVKLRELAALVAEQAYAPYSKFRVGAALLLEDGAMVPGCNVENCSYRLTSCAEQGAIARAVAEFGPKIRVRAVAVANLNGAASMPCGACRQTLSEFGEDAMLVMYPGEGGAAMETTLGELLPWAFRGEYIG